jgi:hypothetical protein
MLRGWMGGNLNVCEEISLAAAGTLLICDWRSFFVVVVVLPRNVCAISEEMASTKANFE